MGSLFLCVYRLMLWLLMPWLYWHLHARVKIGKEDAARLIERQGIATRIRFDGKLIWLHAASVGEALSLLPVIEALTQLKAQILLTTGTVTSAHLLATRLPTEAVHQYVPLDHQVWVRRFLNYWRPDFAIFVESEIWPNILRGLYKRHIPTVILNAHMSAKSARRWRWAKPVFGYFYKTFTTCLAASAEDAARLHGLGIKHIKTIGYLKFSADSLPVDFAKLADLKSVIRARTVWCATSTHDGEDEHILAAHQNLKKTFPNLLTILVPRHLDRLKDIVTLIKQQDLYYALRSSDMLPMANTDIFVIDTMGELGLFYRLAPVSFIGGSLVPIGGHNIIEAAQLESAIVTGPHTENIASIMARFVAARAAWQIGNEHELPNAVATLLNDKARRHMQITAANAILTDERQTLPRIMAHLLPALERAGIIPRD